jgi:signal transduction histidine kinase
MNQSLQRPQQLVDGCTAPNYDSVTASGKEGDKGLRPPAFARLEQAISGLADELRLSERTRLRVFVAGRSEFLEPFIQEQVYLIMREALCNALRHSNATSVETDIEYFPAKFRVAVRDNGCGIKPQALLQNTHLGLLEMHERARQIGAELRVWSREGAGTEVEICVPVQIAQAVTSSVLA